MSYQPQLFETEDQYGNDIIQGPKLNKKKLSTKEALIDPKNPSTVRPHNTGSMPFSSNLLNTSSAFSLVIIIHCKFSSSKGVGFSKLSLALGTSSLNISNVFTAEQLVRNVIRISDRRTLCINFRFLRSINFFLRQR